MRKRLTVLILLTTAVLTGALLALGTAPTSDNTVVPAPAPRVVDVSAEALVQRPQRAVQPKPTRPASSPKPPQASASTLERLALIGQETREEASACFRDAWLDGRLVEDHVALHMNADPASSGAPLHVTAPNTAEHLWDAEACLAEVYTQTAAERVGEPGGMVWTLRLPTARWADDPNAGR